MISIIHPSRSRPDKAASTIKNWNALASDKKSFQWTLALDNDDPKIDEYLGLFIAKHITETRTAVAAINHCAKIVDGDILMVVSDDTEPTQNWDQLIKNSVGSKTDWILKTQDGIQPWIITMPIMDRTYYNRFGYIYHPDYLHMFCDTELTCVADITGRKLTSNLLFPHKHYSVTKEQPDAINKKADATWSQGEKLFLERYKKNFDLPAGQPIQDKGMIDWLKKR